MNKFLLHEAILEWCGENEDNSKLIKYKIHNSPQPCKHPGLRKSLKLSETANNVIRKIGLSRVRNIAEQYIEILSDPLCNELKINQFEEFENAKYATGLCCRACMSVCHSFHAWKRLSTNDKNKMIDVIMKWIQEKYSLEK